MKQNGGFIDVQSEVGVGSTFRVHLPVATETPALAKEADGIEKLEAWDWLHYSERVRSRDYGLDEAEMKPYFSLDAMLAEADELLAMLTASVKTVKRRMKAE